MSLDPISQGAHARGNEADHVEPRTAKRGRRLWRPLIVIAAAGLLLAACSGGSHDAPSADKQTTTSSTSATTAPSTTTTTAASTTTTAPPTSAVSSPASTTTTTVNALAQAQHYTACMRSHGVPEVPEPTDDNGQISFSGGTPGMGRTPAFLSAQQTCSKSVYGTTPAEGSNAG